MELLSINVDEIIEILTKNGAEMKDHMIDKPVENETTTPQEAPIIEIDQPSLIDMEFLNPLKMGEKIGDLINKKLSLIEIQSTFYLKVKFKLRTLYC
jgi:hypothetical protein